MTEGERANAIEEIRRLKARYFRGVDTSDGDMVRDVLAEDCVLDYRGCCTDPATGRDFLPAMNVVLRGRNQWRADGLSGAGIVSVHQGHTFDVAFTSDTTAEGVWSMTDLLYMPPGAPFGLMTGHGWYHETYARIDGAWKIRTIRIARIRVEASTPPA